MGVPWQRPGKMPCPAPRQSEAPTQWAGGFRQRQQKYPHPMGYRRESPPSWQVGLPCISIIFLLVVVIVHSARATY